MSSSFFQKLLNFLNLGASEFLRTNWNFSASIGSFQGLLAEVSEVTLLSQRLALKYNTTPPSYCQHFLTTFFKFFLLLLKPFHLPESRSFPLFANIPIHSFIRTAVAATACSIHSNKTANPLPSSASLWAEDIFLSGLPGLLPSARTSVLP